uniref:Uncharacterized protein n=1 Tax=Noctiluca scintillans TaxID=2966 RepID=A0A7S1EV25_NOCSC
MGVEGLYLQQGHEDSILLTPVVSGPAGDCCFSPVRTSDKDGWDMQCGLIADGEALTAARLEAARLRTVVLRMVNRAWRRDVAVRVFASWKEIMESVRRKRRDAFVDAMGVQMQVAQRRCAGFERVTEQSSLRDSFVAWCGVHTLGRHHLAVEWINERRLLDGAAFCVWRALCAWAQLKSGAKRPLACSPPGSRQCSPLSSARAKGGAGNTLRGVKAGRMSVSNSEHSLRKSNSVLSGLGGVLGSTGDSHRRAVSVRRNDDSEGARLARGPERFFYDTSSYTGCARYGGPSVVDRSNSCSEELKSRRKRFTGPVGLLGGGACSPSPDVSRRSFCFEGHSANKALDEGEAAS